MGLVTGQVTTNTSIPKEHTTNREGSVAPSDLLVNLAAYIDEVENFNFFLCMIYVIANCTSGAALHNFVTYCCVRDWRGYRKEVTKVPNEGEQEWKSVSALKGCHVSWLGRCQRQTKVNLAHNMFVHFALSGMNFSSTASSLQTTHYTL